jgi:hypothetical protein
MQAGKPAGETLPIPLLQSRDIPLRFRLGEYCIGVLQIRAAVVKRHFFDPLPDHYRPDEWIHTAPSNSQALLVPAVPADQMLPGICRDNGLIRYIPSVVPRYYVEIRGSFQEYLKNNFSQKVRYNLNRSVKKLAQLSGGALDLMVCRNREEVDRFYAGAGEVAKLTYQSRLLRSGLPMNEEFRASLKQLADERRLYDYLLFHNGKPIAFAHCVRYQETLCYDVIGYDPEYASMSPGNVLLFQILEAVFAESKLRYFDFGPGEAQYKALFSTNHELVADIYYFRPSLRNFLTIAAHFGLDRFSAGCGKILLQFGLKERIRKWFRAVH